MIEPYMVGGGRTYERWALYGSLLILALFKLYLVAGTDIIAMPYDSYQYLWMSDAWYWGNKYAFARRPGFPLFLALASNTGLPLRLVFEFLFLGASARLATALLRLGFPYWAAILSFALTILLPYAFVWFDFALVECMLSSLLIWATAEFASMLTTTGRRFWGHSLLFAALVTLAWYSRSETILLLGTGFAVALLFIGAALLRRESWRAAALLCLRLFGPAAILVLAAGIAVASLDAVYFGRFSAKEDLRGPAFVRAYDDLQDIRGSYTIRYVPLSSEQMAIAATVSPAFAEIYPGLLGSTGDTYRRIAKNEAGVSNQIAGGWLIWAIREAVDNAGYHTAASQDAFYRRMAGELEAAARAGKIETNSFPLSLVDPHWRIWLPFLPRSVLQTANTLLPIGTLSVPRQDRVDAAITEEFNRRANRRAALVVPDAPDPRAARAERALRFLGGTYRTVMLGLAALALLSLIAGGWRRLTTPILALLLVILLPILGRVCLMALLDASSYPTIGITRYVMPASMLLPSLILCLLALRFRRTG